MLNLVGESVQRSRGTVLNIVSESVEHSGGTVLNLVGESVEHSGGTVLNIVGESVEHSGGTVFNLVGESVLLCLGEFRHDVRVTSPVGWPEQLSAGMGAIRSGARSMPSQIR